MLELHFACIPFLKINSVHTLLLLVQFMLIMSKLLGIFFNTVWGLSP